MMTRTLPEILISLHKTFFTGLHEVLKRIPGLLVLPLFQNSCNPVEHTCHSSGVLWNISSNWIIQKLCNINLQDFKPLPTHLSPF